MNIRNLIRQPLVLVGLGAIVAILAPVGAGAARTLVVKLKDADGGSKAQVDQGKVRIGDGKGGLTVDGTVNVAVPGRGSGLLRQGDCDGLDTYPASGIVGGGRTVTGVVLTVDGLTGTQNDLVITAPSAAGNTLSTGAVSTLFRLRVTNNLTAGDVRQDQLDFGPAGIALNETWTFTCSGGEGVWFVYGY